MKKNHIRSEKLVGRHLTKCNEVLGKMKNESVKGVPIPMESVILPMGSELPKNERDAKPTRHDLQQSKKPETVQEVSSHCHWQAESFGVDYIL